MAYIKYKEITKYFYFSSVILKDSLPKYVNDYKFDDEEFLVGYRTSRDHGVFSTQRIILFDNFGQKKEVTTVPYKSISSCSVVFGLTGADLSLMLDSGYPMRIKFVKMRDTDKKRLRIIYSCIVRAMNNQKMQPEDVQKLIDNNIEM